MWPIFDAVDAEKEQLFCEDHLPEHPSDQPPNNTSIESIRKEGDLSIPNKEIVFPEGEMTADFLQKKSVMWLKNELQLYCQPTTGKKANHVQRLKKAYDDKLKR